LFFIGAPCIYISPHFVTVWQAYQSNFRASPPLQNSNGNPLNGGDKY